jgi:hypothetical protein
MKKENLVANRRIYEFDCSLINVELNANKLVVNLARERLECVQKFGQQNSESEGSSNSEKRTQRK